MDKFIVYHPKLTKPDRIVLETLAADIEQFSRSTADDQGRANGHIDSCNEIKYASALTRLDALNNPKHSDFEPTIFTEHDYDRIGWNTSIGRYVLRPYLRVAQSIVRHETDVVMLTHLILYFSTSVPSALALFFWRFTWVHGMIHFIMQLSYMGTYTLMMHQHIHMRGVLNRQFAIFDHLFPYITDPLMGHTWNSYYYHHVKHHHVEGNGPDDLSSTVRYQRDDVFHFLHYVGRFFFLVWFDLPCYFLRKQKPVLAVKAAFWEIGNYITLASLYVWQPKPTLFVFLLPLFLLRVGLMVGNWGQHAFVDAHEPDSDYRSSITLIDVASNRYSYNDGYHTSHHLNPLRHWRDHPNAFMKGKRTYETNGALVFHNIDYIMITVRLLMKDYAHLAKCMVPIGKEQLAMSLADRVHLLKAHTRRFSEQEIGDKFKSSSSQT
ncbi:fatty acid desaturas-like protein [Xylaria telfairii]|nr:fatty acid desaturas-like protein [Xylaria telfairii]